MENEKKVLLSLLQGQKTWEEFLNETKLFTRTLSKRLKSLIEKGYVAEQISKKDRRREI